MKNYHFGVKLQNRELNLVFVKVLSGFQSFFWGEGGGNHERSVKNYCAGNIPHR